MDQAEGITDMHEIEDLNNRARAEAMVEDIMQMPSNRGVEELLYFVAYSHYDRENRVVVIDPDSIEIETVYSYERLKDKYQDELAKSMAQEVVGARTLCHVTIGRLPFMPITE